ncbi:MAG: hypothetical protein ABIJ36_03030 [Patescibacteria group bacterium]|nr:hypothetical protein [Patescibacteria group bacterium]
MSRKKDKNYRRKIEALRAQLSSQPVAHKPSVSVKGDNIVAQSPLPKNQLADADYTSVAVVKKEVVKSLLLSLICFSIIFAVYILGR